MTAALATLAPGATARVTGYAPGGAAYRQKLLSMGLTPGVTLRVLRVAPLGDPVVIELRGYQLSLRKAEAAALIVEGTPA
ncbi:FeoA family protein [Pseudogemmobacter blasticus]|uniref:Ferrous iron transport protein A n=1 Tax=Fuscovulum blasticum DSM 2131 TaxID=1188250 RepID=A0A2T4JDF3_FUSBL|nr:FeoA family protein [Fuscovulum blasticum]AWD23197.1 ferrous iron transport protein A [Fuscovulum blasticum]PTE15863.1 ferrous iron transport protein A [Fuscovulum blasticum DSM 2131]